MERALFWDTVRVLIFPLAAALIYFGAGLYRESDLRIRGLVVLGIFFGALTALQVYNQFPFIHDYVHYLRRGDAWVMEAQCRVVDTSSGTATGLGMAMVRLYCADGQEFITKYRRDYQRLAWRWARAGQVLRIRYLPRSRLVLEAIPIQ
ncbi:MAG: hypothetical protein RMK65_06895 [Anaerolineae bacterium]|nr:hypothetical protein [Anaerolineae bacterium]MDW7991850.1 hypothetical protein [Anaerolineae bacterium]